MRLRWPLVVSVIVAVALPLALGHWSLPVAFGVWLGAWVVAATAQQLIRRLRESPQATLRARVAAQPRSWYGMSLAHVGVAVFIFGVTLVKGFETERDLRMAPGERVALGGYEFVFKGAKEVPGPNYAAMQGEFEIRRVGSSSSFTLRPEKRLYQVSGQTMTEAAIDPGLVRDIYVSLGEPVGDGAWGVRVYHKPFVDWIWGGCLLMALGGLLAISDRRYRSRKVAAVEDLARGASAQVGD
jgi:cytochrome c-type biogenesis protein CcmF